MIARNGSHTCLLSMLERYVDKAGISPSLKLFLFRAITRTARGEVLRASGSISFARLTELFKIKLRQLGYNAADYGLHSLHAVEQQQHPMLCARPLV